MKRLSIGTWAYCLGPYRDDPIPFGDVVKELKRLKFDGLELGAFFSHPNPENHPTKESRRSLKDLVESNGLFFSGIATDLWDYPGHPSHLADAADGGEHYLSMVRNNLELTRDLGITLFRVDTVQAAQLLDKGFDKNRAMDNVVNIWRKVCRMAADSGIDVAWEFEPQFVFNRPSDIVQIVNAVGERNFGALFDTGNAYLCATLGRSQSGGPKETPGMVELAKMLRGKIKGIQIVDGDDGDGTIGSSMSRMYGLGRIDLQPVLKELEENAGLPHDWWTIDLFPVLGDAWEETIAYKKRADKLNLFQLPPIVDQLLIFLLS
jgi:sugar phosphate isomerase/epimerase